MNTSEDGAQMAPGAPTNGASNSTNSAAKPPARRRRAPNRRTKAENAPPAAETQTESSAEAHAEPHVELAPVASSEAQPAANGATGATEAAGEQAERKTPRPRRARNTKSRRPAVELVRPPASEQAEETVTASAEAPVESAADVVDEVAQPPAEAAPTRRYRFQRPARVATQAGAAPAAMLRPERLSGRIAQSAPVEAEPAPETTESAELEEESLESLLAGLGAADTAFIGEPIVIEEGAPAEPPLLEPEVEPLAEDGSVEAGEAHDEHDEHEEGTATRRRRRRRRTSPHTSEAEGEESAEQPTTRTGGLSVVDFGAPPAVERRQSGHQTQPAETPYAPLSAPYTPGGMQGVRDRHARRTSTQAPAWNTGDASGDARRRLASRTAHTPHQSQRIRAALGRSLAASQAPRASHTPHAPGSVARRRRSRQTSLRMCSTARSNSRQIAS